MSVSVIAQSEERDGEPLSVPSLCTLPPKTCKPSTWYNHHQCSVICMPVSNCEFCVLLCAQCIRVPQTELWIICSLSQFIRGLMPEFSWMIVLWCYRVVSYFVVAFFCRWVPSCKFENIGSCEQSPDLLFYHLKFFLSISQLMLILLTFKLCSINCD